MDNKQKREKKIKGVTMSEELDKESIMKDLNKWNSKLNIIVVLINEINEDLIRIGNQVRGG